MSNLQITDRAYDAKQAQKAQRNEFGNRPVKRPFAVIFSSLFWCGALSLPLIYVFTTENFSLKEFTLISVGIATGLFWIFHGVQYYTSSTRKYLNKVLSTEGAYAYVDRLKKATPSVWFYVECYHWETRTTTSTDADGNTTTSTTEEKVVTYTDKLDFVYNSWSDASGELAGVEGHSIAKLDLRKCLTFADAETRSRYEETRDAFYNSNRGRDNHMDGSEHFSIPGFHPKMLCLVDPHKRPVLLRSGFYLLSMLLVLSVPYRWWFDKATSRVSFEINKCIQC